MNPPADDPVPGLRKAFAGSLLLGLAALALALGRSQTPLFEGNQATYFVHGLAGADCGQLAEDRLAHSRDPTPVFSALLSTWMRHLPETGLYAWFPALAFVFFASLLVIGVGLLGRDAPPGRRHLFLLLALIAFSAEGLCLVTPGEGVTPEALLSGVAEQRVLGRNVEPSTFGVLLLLSLALLARRRERAAALTAALAATIHPTYLAPAGLVMLGAAAHRMWRCRSSREGAWVLGLGVAVMLPITIYVATHFALGDAALRQSAAEILARTRFPHHASPSIWFVAAPARTGTQATLAVLGLVIAWRTPLRGAILLLIAWALAGVAWVARTDDAQVALLFPWRTTTLLVPLGSVAMIALLARVLVPPATAPSRARTVAAGCVILLVGAAVAWSGLQKTLSVVDRRRTDPEAAMLRALATDPEAAGHWSVPPRELPLFRLLARRPVHVDRKSHPYEAGEVHDWSERLRIAESFHGQRGFRDPLRREAFARLEGVSHLVVPRSEVATLGDAFAEIARGSRFVAGRLVRDAAADDLVGFRLGEGWDPRDAPNSSSTRRRAEALVVFDTARPWTLHLRCAARLFTPSMQRQDLELAVGDRVLGTWELTREARALEISLPRDLETGAARLQFRLPDAASPAELGIGPDRRRLGMRLLSAELRPTRE